MTSEAAAVAEHTEGPRETRTGHPAWARLACVYLPAPLPRDGRLAFWDPAGDPLPPAPEGAAEELTVVRRHGAGARRHRVPALTLPLAAALPPLVRGRV
ncbi:ATP-dependent helicase, partial [Streptomyces sp. MBT70]|nr:ATP-dependent helicase [Streptomyces sp. MBT70]